MDPQAAQDELTERLRMLLFGEASLREVAMFGGRSFMVEDKMVAHARKGGKLLVRVDGARHEELTARSGAGQAFMGAERSMGPGWIDVAPEAISTDDQLARWVEIALEYNRAVAK